MKLIKRKYTKAGYPRRFVDSVIRSFNEKARNLNETDEFIIPPNFFEIKKPFILIEIPYCETNDIASKLFLKKFHDFTSDKFDAAIKWKTRKMKSLFIKKDRNLHLPCKICKGECTCGTTYIGETERNISERWAEHVNINNKSEPARHSLENAGRSFTWTVLLAAPKNSRTRKKP